MWKFNMKSPLRNSVILTAFLKKKTKTKYISFSCRVDNLLVSEQIDETFFAFLEKT